MAQADSQSTTHPAFLGSSETHVATDAALSLSAAPGPAAPVISGPQASDPIFNAIKAHKRELDRRNQTIEALCAAEERHKTEERDAWHRYEEASTALLTTKPTTLAGLAELNRKLKVIQRSIERAERMRGRFRRNKPGDNTIEQVIDWEIGEFKRSIVMNEAGVKQRERAVELLRDYDFVQDISTRAFTIRRGRIPSDRDPGG